MASFSKWLSCTQYRLSLNSGRRNLQLGFVRRKSSKENAAASTSKKLVSEKELQYVETELPKQIALLLKKKSSTKKNLSNLEVIRNFGNGGYQEKSVLVDPGISQRILRKVLDHTEKGPDTVFLDGEAGLNLLASEVAQSGEFSSVKVLEKDPNLLDVHVELPEDVADRVDLYPHVVSFHQIARLAVLHGLFYPTPVYPLVPDAWTEDYPPYTLVTTSSLPFIKYLTMSWLYSSQNPKLSFFKDSRPEYFLLMTMKTFFQINGGVPSLTPWKKKPTETELKQMKDDTILLPMMMVKNSYLFRLLFDCYLVDMIPRRGFIPWRTNLEDDEVDLQMRLEDVKKNFSSLSSHSVKNIYQQYEDHLMLVYIRPKSELGVELSDPASLDYFVDTLARKSATATVLPTLENWISGMGIQLINLGYSVFTTVGEIQCEDLLKLYQALINHPNFHNSTFQAGRDTMLKYINVREGKIDSSAEGFEVTMLKMRNEKKRKRSKIMK